MKTLLATIRTSSTTRLGESVSLPQMTYRTGVPAWKRVLDLSLVVLAAPVWLPLMLALGAWIKLLSPGPMFFRQERIGLGERKFICFKLRTMRANADTATHQQHLTKLFQSDAPLKKLDGADSRLIPGAWVLRSTGLDELPQLINVLRGEMSLVGPRPCTPYEFANFKDWQRERFQAMPGLTGLWQVNGKNRTTFTRMIELDIHYARTSCLSLDLGILLRTFPAVAGQFFENRLERAQLHVSQKQPAVRVQWKMSPVKRGLINRCRALGNYL